MKVSAFQRTATIITGQSWHMKEQIRQGETSIPVSPLLESLQHWLTLACPMSFESQLSHVSCLL